MKKGFTLIELMVTISIMAVLATVGVVVYSNAQTHVRDGRRKADLKEIQKALEQYNTISGNNSYPTDIYATTPVGLIISSPIYFNKGSTPKDPSYASPSDVYSYFYVTPATCKKFIVCATLEKPTGNRNALPTGGSDYCVPAQAPENVTSGGAYYCLGSLQN